MNFIILEMELQKTLFVSLVGFFAVTLARSPPTSEKKVEILEVGGYCAPAAAPVGPNGAWMVIESDVKKICPEGTECRKGACNCNDEPNGTITGISSDANGNRVCRRVANQVCSSDDHCFNGVKCVGGKCTCDENDKDTYCVDQKNDVYIMN